MNVFTRATQLLSGLLPKTEQHPDVEYAEEKCKSWLVHFFGTYGPLFCAIIIAYGDGYWFSDMRMLSWDPWVIVCYITGITLAGIGMALLYSASKHYHNQQYKHMILPIAIFFVFGFVSAMAQYLLLLHQLDVSGMTFATTAVEQIPAFSLLLGAMALKGMPGFLFLRVLLYHVAEFSCVFLVRERKPDIEATLKKKRETQIQVALLDQQAQALAMIEQMQQLTMRAASRAMAHMQEEAEYYSGASLANRHKMAGIEPATPREIATYSAPTPLRTIPKQKAE